MWLRELGDSVEEKRMKWERGRGGWVRSNGGREGRREREKGGGRLWYSLFFSCCTAL